jgi:hypothetical protein
MVKIFQCIYCNREFGAYSEVVYYCPFCAKDFEVPLKSIREEENKINVEYELRIILKPHIWDNKKEPYFWSIIRTDENGMSSNTGLCGWAKDIEKAYQNGFNSWCEKYGD